MFYKWMRRTAQKDGYLARAGCSTLYKAERSVWLYLMLNSAADWLSSSWYENLPVSVWVIMFTPEMGWMFFFKGEEHISQISSRSLKIHLDISISYSSTIYTHMDEIHNNFDDLTFDDLISLTKTVLMIDSDDNFLCSKGLSFAKKNMF